VPIPSGISNEKGQFLHELVCQLDPTISLEVGLAYGISAVYICAALQIRLGTRHIAIDPYQYRDPYGRAPEGAGIENLQQAGFGEIVELIEKPSYQALPALEADGTQIDFAFIDGWHTFDFTLVDFFYIDRMLRVGGIVALDDANWPSVQKVCRFVATNCAYSAAGAVGAPATPTWQRRLAERCLAATPLRKCLRPEARRGPEALGTNGQCVAFRKQSDDRRIWDHFIEF